MRFIFLVGLPGSGKTHYGKRMGLPFLDDVTQHGGLEAVQELAKTTDTIVLSDYSFIFPTDRHQAEYVLNYRFPGCKIYYIAFDNDPEKCWANIQFRDDGRVITRDSLFRASERYGYPEHATRFPVYAR
jgi:hypothetical protein